MASVVAWGGVGKSALVNAWLQRMDKDNWRGAERVFGWSFYSQGTDRLSSSDEFIDVALRWLGDPDPTRGSAWDKGERLAELVRQRRTILVLDGLEPLQWGPGVQEGRLKDQSLEALLKELAAQNKGMCLITTRIHVADLAGDKVRECPLEHLAPEDGAELLQAGGVKGAHEELLEASSEYKGHCLALTLLSSYLTDVAEGEIRKHKEIGPLEQDERLGGHARRVMTAYEPWVGKSERSILLMLGLFDRPACQDEIAALTASPVIPNLTDGVWVDPAHSDHAGAQLLAPARLISDKEWTRAVAKLCRVGLVASNRDKRLDAHPLVREHFAEQLKQAHLEAWREGHRRLYEHLKQKAKELPGTIEEMAPLYAAVVHGCLAGKNQEVLVEVHFKRIHRGNEAFSIKTLGAVGSEAAVLSAFFDPPWECLAPGLSEPWQAWALNEAGFVLRALGRLPEATELMRLNLIQDVAREHWERAAIGASNLSEVLQSRGKLREAEATARESVAHADRSGDAFQRMGNRTTLAAALHALGRRNEAAALFEEAERMQKEDEPAYPLLYSVQGFQYCDLLLDQGQEADVLARAAQTLEWVTAQQWVLDISLDHLSLSRAHHLAAQKSALPEAQRHNKQAAEHLQQAVDGLRHASQQLYLPLGLLARAAFHLDTGAHDLARHDLDEALTLAARCGFRLHEADARLGLARLALVEGDSAAARTHLDAARSLAVAAAYHRRDGELSELEARARGEA